MYEKRGENGDWPGPHFPASTEGQVPQTNVIRLRECCVLWCESCVPTETAEPSVHGA